MIFPDHHDIVSSILGKKSVPKLLNIEAKQRGIELVNSH